MPNKSYYKKYIHTYIHTYLLTYAHTYIHIYIHTYTHILEILHCGLEASGALGWSEGWKDER